MYTAQQTHSYYDDRVTSPQNDTEPGTPNSAGSDIWPGDQPQVCEVSTAHGEEEEDHLVQSNLPMTAFNVINSIVGSGIIAIPFALKEAGVGMGLIMLVVVSVATDYSLNMLITAGHLSNSRTYQDLMRVSFGQGGFLVLTVAQGMYPFIAMISYNVIIGDIITKLVVRVTTGASKYTILGNRQFIIFLSTLFLTLPLSLYRRIASLTKVSLLSTLIIVFIIITMLIRMPAYTSKEIGTPDEAWRFANWNIPQAVALMSFSFMCQHNSYLCYYSLKQRTVERWSLVVHLAVAFSFLASALFGLVGYASFTDLVYGDILENYCYRDDLINVSRVLFAVTIMLTYPVECFVVREVIENTIFAREKPLAQWKHIGLTVALCGVAMILSMTTDCLNTVMELNGIVTATPLAFIFPPLCLLRLQNEKVLQMKNAGPLAVLVFGALVALFGSVLFIMDVSQGQSCGEDGHLVNAYCSPGWRPTATNVTHYNATSMS